MTSKVYKKQIGREPLRNMVVQPSEFVNKNKVAFNFAEGPRYKVYMQTCSERKQEQDIEKAIHYLEMILERDYEDTKV